MHEASKGRPPWWPQTGWVLGLAPKDLFRCHFPVDSMALGVWGSYPKSPGFEIAQITRISTRV